MHRLYPNYDSAIQAHIAADPAKPLRQAVDAARLLNSNLPIVLFISHLQGGGTIKHAEELAVLFNNQMQTLLFGPVVGKRHALYWVRNEKILSCILIYLKTTNCCVRYCALWVLTGFIFTI
ncbi:MAG: hypothetical protein IPL59_15880 [Candidatus Competibacteraceae bacterium]|nr:hypothetical protein [Candidatus Competibacteraceae bacterium]